jgi:hypothetical protein
MVRISISPKLVKFQLCLLVSNRNSFCPKKRLHPERWYREGTWRGRKSWNPARALLNTFTSWLWLHLLQREPFYN